MNNLYHSEENTLKKNVKTACGLSIFVLILYYISHTFLIEIPIKTAINELSLGFGTEILKINTSWSSGFILFLVGTILIIIIVITEVLRKFSEHPIKKERMPSKTNEAIVIFKNFGQIQMFRY